MTINSLSLTSVFLEMYFNDKKLSTGTGFIYKDIQKSKYYIITNWHNFSGKNNLSGKLLDTKNGALPNKIRVHLHIKGKIGHWYNGDIDLYDKMEDLLGKRWLEHPTFKEKVDVVAFPIGIPEECEDFNIVDELIEWDYKQDYIPSVGDSAFILGYPLGLDGGGKLPIWKSASIASEPDIDINDLPLFYIDAATREGMSGSAVIVKEKRAISLKEREGGRESHYRTKLLGVYSGRVGVDDFGHAVGRVWKAKVIDEIIEGRYAQTQ